MRNITFKIMLVLLVQALNYSVLAGTDAKPVSSSSGSNINDNANKTKSQNDKSQGISQLVGVANMALGAMYVKQGSSCSSQCSGCPEACGCCPQAPMLYAQGALHFLMGAQSFQQAGANGNASGQAGMTGYDTSAINPYGDPGKETNYLDPNSNIDPSLKNAVNTKGFMDTKKALTSKDGLNGVKMDPKTGVITTPDGKTYDPSSLTDKAAMSKAGFSDSIIDGAYAANAAFEKEAKKKVGGVESIGAATASNGYQDGGSSASYGGASTATSSGGGYGSSSSRVPASGNKVAGLTKNFNGEKIGVAAENIFNMMTRRFKVMEKRDSFFDPSELIPLTQ